MEQPRLPTVNQFHQMQIEDIELEAINANVPIPPTAKGSDYDLRARSLANALGVLTANQVIQIAASDAENAEGDELEAIRKAEGLPEVTATQATGKIRVTSTALIGTTVPDGTALLCTGALPAKTIGTATGVVDGSELAFTVTKAGAAGNLKAGTIVRFVSPPPGLAGDAVVAADMIDGADTETDTKKRRRIRNRRQNPPKGGNWPHLRELALGSSNALDNAFVYPALGLPSSALVAITAPWYIGAEGQSRVATAGTVAAAQFNIESAVNTDSELVVAKSTADEMVDIRLLLDVLPGNAGWIDAAPWPSVATHVSAFTASTSFTVEMESAATAPAVGKSIAIWAPDVCEFRTAVIQSVSPIDAQHFTITVSAWTGGAFTMNTSYQISPAAGNIIAWGAKVLEIVGEQTPGEACFAWQEPRALRKPLESNDEPTGIGAREVNQFIADFDELRDAVIGSINVDTPTRVTPSANPRVLCIRSISLGVK